MRARMSGCESGRYDGAVREAARLASRPTVDEWLDRTRRRSSAADRAQVIEALDEQRGPWPDARR